MSNRDKSISLLLPTYRRTESLDKVLVSIEEKTSIKNRITLSLYIDDDDTESIGYISSDKLKKFTYCINTFIAPKTESMGSMIDYLHKNTPRADIYMPMVDDYLIVTYGWDLILNDLFVKYPDGLFLAFPQDPISPDNVTLAILGGSWIATLGRFLTNYFPFWYDDLWLDQVAQMVQRRIAVPIKIEPIDGKGKTPRMFNLWFWQQFFHNTMDERVEDANKIRRIIYPANSVEFDRNKFLGENLAARFDLKFRKITKTDCLLTEFMLADRNKRKYFHLESKYLIKEICAVLHLCDKLVIDLEYGLHHRQYQLIENIASSSIHSKYVGAISSMRNSINFAKVNEIVQELRQELNAVLSALKMGHSLSRNQVHIPKYPAKIFFLALFVTLKDMPVAKRFIALYRRYRPIKDKI
jgi:hypothetical protein